MSFYRDQLETFLKTINVNAKTVIDLGGKQKPIKGRTKSWDVEEFHILDLPEYNIDETISFDKKADVLFCLEVFEYLICPITAMRNIKKLLNENGTAYVTFPLVYPVHNEVEYDSLRYTISGINRICNHAGMKIDKVINRKTKTNSLVKYYLEDGMKMAKGMNHQITGYIIEMKPIKDSSQHQPSLS